ncbi:MAG: FAD-dependent oxidoreductase [Pyrinomonadaceae bacterium]
MNTKPRIAVVGGGFAGLESIFYLRHKLHDKADLTLISDTDHFTFKPNTIYIPFGTDPESLKVDLRGAAAKKNIDLIVDEAEAVDVENKKIIRKSGETPFDYLVLATGAAMRPEEIPGLKEHALTPWTIAEMLDLRHGIENLVEKAAAGERQKLLFLVPPNNKCSGPLYELVMMTDTWLNQKRVRENVDITWTTYEESFIQAFGPRLNTVVEDEFLTRKIHGYKTYTVKEVTPNKVMYQNGVDLDYDLLISFPPYIAKHPFEGLPMDDRGFITVEPDSRRVEGTDSIFAVGDGGNFPIKQAFLALLQGDAAGAHIAAEIEGRAVGKTEKFEPMSMCVMEEFDKATFAQVPLMYTSDPLKPVTVNLADTDHYKVGVSPLWRGGKKILGFYLPWRFGNGEPFHAGFAWDAMDLGLKLMSKVMAS